MFSREKNGGKILKKVLLRFVSMINVFLQLCDGREDRDTTTYPVFSMMTGHICCDKILNPSI